MDRGKTNTRELDAGLKMILETNKAVPHHTGSSRQKYKLKAFYRTFLTEKFPRVP